MIIASSCGGANASANVSAGAQNCRPGKCEREGSVFLGIIPYCIGGRVKKHGTCRLWCVLVSRYRGVILLKGNLVHYIPADSHNPIMYADSDECNSYFGFLNRHAVPLRLSKQRYFTNNSASCIVRIILEVTPVVKL